MRRTEVLELVNPKEAPRKCGARVKWSSLWQSNCEGEVIVQGDEGPVCGVAQVVDCHGVTGGHQEREEEEEQQEVEGEGEEHSKNAAHGWHADGVNDKCERP